MRKSCLQTSKSLGLQPLLVKSNLLQLLLTFLLSRHRQQCKNLGRLHPRLLLSDLFLVPARLHLYPLQVPLMTTILVHAPTRAP
jgi:hypothetical protein